MSKETHQNITHLHGTAQSQRYAASLFPDYVKVDERTLSDLLAYLAKYAKQLKFHHLPGTQNTAATQDTTWAQVLEKDEAVFLAQIITTDFQSIDESIQLAFVRMHQLEDQKEQIQNCHNLITHVLELSTVLDTWYQRSKNYRTATTTHRIETEIERAIMGDLGIQFKRLCTQIDKLKKKQEFSSRFTWERQIQGLQSSWPLANAAALQKLHKEQNEGETFKDFLTVIGICVQEYYRRLYYTLAYVSHLAPDLLEISLTTKNDHQPDVGLLLAFLKLFGHAQTEINQITRKHLDYYYETLLGQSRMPAVSDRTIVSFELKPATRNFFLAEGSLLSAGVNEAGVASHYRTLNDLLITQARVVQLKTLFVSKNPLVKTGSSYRLVNAIYAAAVANSLDGQGLPFETEQQTWPILGEDQFDLAKADQQMSRSSLGFALAAGIFALKEGERTVTVSLNFTPESFAVLIDLLEDIVENSAGESDLASVFRKIFNQPFRITTTGPKGWWEIKKYIILPAAEGWQAAGLQLRFELAASEQPIAPYDPAIHGGDYATQHPILSVALRDDAPLYAYSFLQDLQLEEIQIDVAVKGLKTLTVYNDQSLLDASAPFVPFGPTPRKNSYLLFGNTELFNRELTELDITLDWMNLPETAGGFSEHYAAYDQGTKDEDFTVNLSALSDYNFQPIHPEQRDEFPLFTLEYGSETPLRKRRKLSLGEPELKKLRLQPQYTFSELEEYTNQTRTGYFKLTLSNPPMAFGHAIYPRIFARQMAIHSRPQPFSFLPHPEEPLLLPNEPYTPMVDRLSVDYKATTAMNFRKLDSLKNQPEAGNKLFRLHPFGTELVFDNGIKSPPYLVPQFRDDGYLFIGISQLNPPESISLFFDISDSDKKIRRTPLELRWSYLYREQWVPFEADKILYDSTLNLTTKGIISLRFPSDISFGSKLLGQELYWICVSGTGNLDISGRCREVVTQVAEVEWVNNGDAKHLNQLAVERPKIDSMVNSRLPIAKVNQLLPFYGGTLAEDTAAYYVRTSERLRHKNRGIQAWDVERLVLRTYPDIHQVKCIGRQGNEADLKSGQVLVVVIPRIDAQGRLPKVGYHTLVEIESLLRERISPFVDLRVINPVYERVKVTCQLQLKGRYDLQRGKSWDHLHAALRQAICPWLKQGTLELGGSVSKNELLACLQENERVAFVTAFSLVHIYERQEDDFFLEDTERPNSNSEVVTANRPWSVLVPVEEHQLTFLDEAANQSAQVTALDGMRLETDFIITPEGGFAGSGPRDNYPEDEPGPDIDIIKTWLSS